MPITTACPHCDRPYVLADAMKDKSVRCKDCGQVFLVEPVGAKKAPPKTPRAASTTTAPEKPAARKKAPAPVDDDEVADVVAADNDDDFEEDDQPRRGAKRTADTDQPKRGGGLALWLVGGGVLGFVLLLGCGGAGVGAWYLLGTPAVTTGPSIAGGPPGDPLKPPQPGAWHVPAAKEEVALSAPAADVVAGGGGRYLVLHLQTMKKLAIFDGYAGKVVKELPLEEDVIHFAANQTKLVVLYPIKKTITIYNLGTFETINSVPYPGELRLDDIRQVCMGSASQGPLFVYQPRLKQTYAVDLPTMTPSDVKWTHWSPNGAYGPLNMRASADGSLLVGWNGGWAGMEVATFANGRQTGSNPNFEFSLGLFALPSADSRLIYTQWAVAPLNGPAPKDPALAKAYLVPSEDPGYFIALRSQRDLPNGFADKEPLPAPNDITVYNEDRKLMFSLSDCDELKQGNTMPWDKRIHFHPSVGLLITLSAAKDRLVLRKIDMNKRL